MTRFWKAALMFSATVIGFLLTLAISELLAWWSMRECPVTTVERAVVALERLAEAEERQAAALEKRKGGR
jgi:hypothetical protein